MQHERRFWDRRAAQYDGLVNRMGSAYSQMLELVRATLPAGGAVLEVATGTANIALHCQEETGLFCASDSSLGMLQVAGRKVTGLDQCKVRLLVQDARSLSFPEGTFDAVICANAFHVIAHPEKALNELFRVLRPGGILIAPNYLHGYSRRSSAISIFLRVFGFKVYRRFSQDSYTKFIAAAGFHDLRLELLPGLFPIAYLEARKRLLTSSPNP